MTYLITTPGYDPRSGLYLAPIGTIVEVPEAPTPEQVQTAADSLLEPWQDFPFASPGQDIEPEASRSVAVYGMMIATNRRGLNIAPGIAIDSHAEGMSNGKTLGSKLICIMATGEDPIPIVLGANFDEQRKALVTYLITGNGALLIDNMPNGIRFDSSALASVMTSPRFMDRLLGANKDVVANTQVMVVVNGNALNLAGDLASRFLKMCLDTGIEKPQNRSSSNYRIRGDLVAWMVDNRQRLVAAVHTIVRAYLQDCRRHGGTPKEVEARRKVDGSRFSGQCEVLRDAFLWAFPHLPDPFLGGEASSLSSSTRQEKSHLIHMLDQRMAELAGQKQVPAWFTAKIETGLSEEPERKSDWRTSFVLRCGRLKPEELQQRWGTTELNQAEIIAWNRVRIARLTRLGRREVRAGRARFSCSELLLNADKELTSALQSMLPRDALLGSITLGRWLKSGLVNSVIDGLVVRSVQNKGKGLALFWIERAARK